MHGKLMAEADPVRLTDERFRWTRESTATSDHRTVPHDGHFCGRKGSDTAPPGLEQRQAWLGQPVEP
ncbi:hypothetical protein D9M72_289320 [compost metagenome]